jgi:quinoprotein glucose dehydrogenase
MSPATFSLMTPGPRPLWKFNTGAGVFGSPSVYMVNGEQFVAVASGGGDRGRWGGDLILAFALTKR